MSKKYEIPFLIFEVENHLLIKNDILNGIQKMGKHCIINQSQNIANTDWHLSGRIHRPYYQYVEKVFRDVADFINKKFNYDEQDLVNFSNFWFQQYESGGMHTWHKHENTSFSCCYYVDLFNDNPKTSFELFGEIFEIDVREGVVLIFPAFLRHCSKANESKHTKTIISFNVT